MKQPQCFWRMILAALAALLLRECYAMPHGQRDWSNIGADEVVHGLADLAEAVARLGSPMTHNREGNVVLLDSFEYGLRPYEIGTSGDGAGVIVSAQKYRSSGYSCKMVAGSTGGGTAQIARAFPYPVLGRHGLEFSVNLDANVEYLIWTLAHRAGATEHQYQCMYMPDDEKIVVTIAGYTAVDAMTDIHLDTSLGLFHTVKLVANFASAEYLRLIVNEREVDLSQRDEYSFAHATTPHLIAIISLYGKAGTNATIYVDDLILTQNEPP